MRRSRRELKGALALRLGASVIAVSVLVTLLSSGLYLFVQWQHQLEHIERQLDDFGPTYMPGIAERLWVADRVSLRLDLAGLLNLEAIEYLAVREDGSTLVEVGQVPSDGAIRRNYPIFYTFRGKQIHIGELSLAASLDVAHEKLTDSVAGVVFAIAIQTFLVSGTLLLLFNQQVTRHLRAIAQFARNLQASTLGDPLELDRNRRQIIQRDELDVLVEAFNTMQLQLNEFITAIRDSEENLSLTLNCIGDAVIATDPDAKVTRMNPVAEQLTGWTLREAQGRPITDVFPIVHATTREVIENPIYQTLSSRQIVTLSNHTTLVTKSGSEYQIADSAAPILNENNTIIGAILVFHDVTEQYQMRQSLRENERRLKLHVEQTPLGVIEWNREFEVVAWNPAAEKMFGFSRDESIGRHAFELIVPPFARDEVVDVWRNLLNNQAVTHQVNKNCRKDGRMLICEWFNTPLVDGDGVVIGVASLVDDITERVQADQKLRLQQLEQEQILNGMLDAVVSVDEDGTVLSFNKAAEALLGYDSEEIVGRNFGVLMPEGVAQQYGSLITKYLETGIVTILGRAHETLIKDKAGGLTPVRMSIAQLPDTTDGKIRFVTSVHDLSSEKRTEEQLRQSQKMDALGKLTGGIAHDYNNMLGLVLGYTELLQEALVDQPKLAEFVDKIQHAGERGVQLTQKLLAFSRLKPVEESVTNINAIIEDQRDMLEKMLTARIGIETELEPKLWLVCLDVGDFVDGLVNLCINAMHAMASGGTLTFNTANEYLAEAEALQLGLDAGDYVKLCVTDTGTGMDDETVERIFDPFFSTKGEQGTGLGLSQVYGFVERSQGAIKAYSELGRGSRFALYFPRYVATDDVANESSQQNDFSLGGQETILVVDDEADLLDLAAEVLGRRGYTVLTANNGEKALQLLRSRSIDLLLTDVIMPNMDGYELAARAKKARPTVKIQLLSGFDESVNTEYFDPELQDNLITKPYSSRTLLARIRQVLDRA